MSFGNLADVQLVSGSYIGFRYLAFHFFSFLATKASKSFIAAHNAFIEMTIDFRFVSFEVELRPGNGPKENDNGSGCNEIEATGHGSCSAVYARKPQLCG
jgi:hypothetical protein